MNIHIINLKQEGSILPKDSCLLSCMMPDIYKNKKA